MRLNCAIALRPINGDRTAQIIIEPFHSSITGDVGTARRRAGDARRRIAGVRRPGRCHLPHQLQAGAMSAVVKFRVNQLGPRRFHPEKYLDHLGLNALFSTGMKFDCVASA